MIRLARKDEIHAIMNFIDTYWREGHILAVNEELFRYEYESDNGLNIVISVNENGIIDGMEGFIPYGHHNRDTLLSLWKANKTDNLMLGVEILQYLIEHTDSKHVACAGINRKTSGIYHFLGIHTGKMNQWYRLADKDSYNIAKIEDNLIPAVINSGKKLLKFNTFQELMDCFDFDSYKAADSKPYKEAWYIEKRYFNHPIYKYDVYGVINGEKYNTLLVFRAQKVGDAIAYRFVDVIGDFNEVYSCTGAIDEILTSIGAEYIDFYEAGMDEERMKQSGWLMVEGSGNIIPNYFAPFVQENIDIHYCSSDKDIHLFKADGDQDRPN